MSPELKGEKSQLQNVLLQPTEGRLSTEEDVWIGDDEVFCRNSGQRELGKPKEREVESSTALQQIRGHK